MTRLHPVQQGVKALQEKVKKAARSYLAQGNTAVERDWAELRSLPTSP